MELLLGFWEIDVVRLRVGVGGQVFVAGGIVGFEVACLFCRSNFRCVLVLVPALLSSLHCAVVLAVGRPLLCPFHRVIPGSPLLGGYCAWLCARRSSCRGWDLMRADAVVFRPWLLVGEDIPYRLGWCPPWFSSLELCFYRFLRRIVLVVYLFTIVGSSILEIIELTSILVLLKAVGISSSRGVVCLEDQERRDYIVARDRERSSTSKSRWSSVQECTWD